MNKKIVFIFLLDNQEKTPKCWCVMPAIRDIIPSVSNQLWILSLLTLGNAELVPFFNLFFYLYKHHCKLHITFCWRKKKHHLST